MSSNSIKIFITTDSHLGYKEKDETLSNDAFVNLENAFQLAEHFDCDLLLHSGDLFHTATPSHWSVNKALKLFSQYCLGSKQLEIKNVSPEYNACELQLNIDKQSSINIKLPVFCIHGNHDPPVYMHNEKFGVMDILTNAGLINDIGKITSFDKFAIKPVILKKKDQYVCLYGLGYIHDEKVNKLFLHRNIHFEPPPKDLERKVFCILLLHQNRYRIKSAVKPEQCFENQNIPDFINFVVWGHEHECELSEVKLNSQTRILQPGSSVITSLKLHESMPKNHFILELKQNRYRLHRLPISTARIFIYDEIESDNVVESDTVHEKIQILVAKAEEKTKARNNDYIAQMNICCEKLNVNKTFHPALQERLPLLRLRIFAPGMKVSFSELQHRFAQSVANPDTLVLYSLKRKSSALPSAKSETKSENEQGDDPLGLLNVNLSCLCLQELNLQVKSVINGAPSTILENYIDQKYNSIFYNKNNIAAQNNSI